VTKQFFDVQGAEVESVEDEAFDHVQYEITLTNLIEGVTTSGSTGIRVMNQGTEAEIRAVLPDDVQTSAPPLSGKWKV